jgi:hypothetical protein
MAKRVNDDAGADKGKIRLLYAEVEGNNQSLQDALKTMVTAMNRPVQLITAPSRIAPNSPAGLGTQAEQPAFEDQTSAETLDDGPSVESNDTSAGPTRKRGGGPKTDRNAGIKLVPNLDFVPDGEDALKKFFAEKGPKSDMEQVLVLVYYMQHTIALPAIGPGHILTAFKDVGKPVPVDLRGTIRNMKNQKAWLNFTDLEAIRVTTQGDNIVEHELGAETNA